MLSALWHGASFFFGVYLLWDYGLLAEDGQVFGLWSFGVTAMTVCVIVVTIKLSMETKYVFTSTNSILLCITVLSFWTWMHFVANIGSVLIYFLFLIIYGLIYTLSPSDMVYLFSNLSKHAGFWFVVMWAVGVSILPDIVVKWFRQSISPADWQILRVCFIHPSFWLWTHLLSGASRS